jgi:uroporphyrinogen decarboxylase
MTPLVNQSNAAHTLSGRDRFLRACACEPVDRPPVWLMRQAGRALPEYRALKEKHSFLEMVQTPDLATEVTLQPIRRFGFDGAVLFSDILIAAEAMGQRYRFRDSGGIEMEFRIESEAEMDRLETGRVRDRLDYVARALKQLKAELGGKTALLGFAGSPWTLANFMIEGGGVREHVAAKSLFYSQPKVFARLCEKLTAVVAELLELQIEAGADAVQIFDSLGGLLAGDDYAEASGRWIAEIIARLRGRVPVIVFARGVHHAWDGLVGTGANALSVDWTVSLGVVRSRVPDRIALQGNLDPHILSATPEVVSACTTRILEQMRGRNGHIFNLGHGLTPAARLECIEALVTTVRSSS